MIFNKKWSQKKNIVSRKKHITQEDIGSGLIISEDKVSVDFSFLNTKLDKDGFNGTAKTLDNDITTLEDRVLKLENQMNTKLDISGGTINGSLTVTGDITALLT